MITEKVTKAPMALVPTQPRGLEGPKTIKTQEEGVDQTDEELQQEYERVIKEL